MVEESTSTIQEDDGSGRIGLRIGVGTLIGYFLLLAISWRTEHFALSLTTLLMEVALISVVIWQACDPFADAAQWIGKTFRLPGSVRGATLDAVASSMPELFSGIFFVLVAVLAADGPAAREAAGVEGFGSTIATCAGSAVYNMILIPAFCALVISFSRPNRPTIDVEDEVISRDGLWFVGCQTLLIIFLYNERMSWWMGGVLLAVYGAYIVVLYRHALAYREKMSHLAGHFEVHGSAVSIESVVDRLDQDGIRVSRALVIEAQEKHVESTRAIDDDNGSRCSDTAGLFFGLFDVRLTHKTAWLVIAGSTIVAAVACYFLVDATIETARLLGVPTFFVAVILAAAASSVPDTLLAIGAAQRGDDSGAVSNAFGSSIFDICVSLSIPLFVNSYLTEWQPVSLMQDGQPIRGIVILRMMLVVLTLITLSIMWHRKQLTRLKAVALCGLYAAFIAYAVFGSLGLI